MDLPELVGRVPRPALLIGVAALALLVVVAVAFSSGGGDGGGRSAVVPTTALGDFEPTATPPAEATSTPEPEPTAVAIAHRTNCAEIRGTSYESDAEREWFQQNCTGSSAGAAAATTGGGGGGGSGPLRSSSDRLVLQRLGINAPINYRIVGTDGQMGDPAGPYDVVWYDFSNFSGFGGYPGDGGNAVMAGHVDYRGVGPAVFYQLRNVNVGDLIQYRRADGQTLSYSVTSITDVSPGANWDPIVSKGGGEAITLITCVGQFDYTTREYSLRRVVKAVRQ